MTPKPELRSTVCIDRNLSRNGRVAKSEESDTPKNEKSELTSKKIQSEKGDASKNSSSSIDVNENTAKKVQSSNEITL